MIFDASQFHAALADVVREVEGCDDPATIVGVLKSLAGMTAAIKGAVVAIEDRYVAVAPKVLDVPLLGRVEVKRSASRTQWDNDTLAAHVIARARDERMFDPDTGEALEDEHSAALRVLKDCASFSWKVTGLRQHGIDPAEFCTETWKRPSVVLPS